MITIWITQTGIFTNKIRIKIDNIYMTNDEIERVSQRVADLVLEGILQRATTPSTIINKAITISVIKLFLYWGLA